MEQQQREHRLYIVRCRKGATCGEEYFILARSWVNQDVVAAQRCPSCRGPVQVLPQGAREGERAQRAMAARGAR